MAQLVVEDKIEPGKNPAFWELFGPDANRSMVAIAKVFDSIKKGPWAIFASCSLDGKDPKCTDPYMYGGIGEGARGADFAPTLVFCQEFFTLPPLD